MSTPGTLEMPPFGKSAGTWNWISSVWVAGSAGSTFFLIVTVALILRSGMSTSPLTAVSSGALEPVETDSVRQVTFPRKACPRCGASGCSS
jgi:hypothetical protein